MYADRTVLLWASARACTGAVRDDNNNHNNNNMSFERRGAGYLAVRKAVGVRLDNGYPEALSKRELCIDDDIATRFHYLASVSR